MWAGAPTDVISSRPCEFFSETNDNSAAILLTYATVHILLAGDAEEEYMADGLYNEALNGQKRSETTHTLRQGSAPC